MRLFGKNKDNEKGEEKKEDEDETYSYETLKKYQEKAGLDLIHMIEDALKANALIGITISHNYNSNQLPNTLVALTVNTIAYDNYQKKKESEKKSEAI